MRSSNGAAHVLTIDPATAMKTTLTLHVDEEVLESAKQYAEARGRSVEELFEQYLRTLSQKSEAGSLTDILGSEPLEDVSEDEYYEYLWQKHR